MNHPDDRGESPREVPSHSGDADSKDDAVHGDGTGRSEADPPRAEPEPLPEAESNPPPGKSLSGGYNVGYGKPPVDTRFQKGQSGNPSGRPAGRKRVNALILDEAFRPVHQTGAEDLELIPAIQALLRGQYDLALKGNGPAQRFLIKAVMAAEEENSKAEEKSNAAESETGHMRDSDSMLVNACEEILERDLGPDWRKFTRPGPFSQRRRDDGQ